MKRLFLIIVVLIVSMCFASPLFAWFITYEGRVLEAGTNAWTTESGQVMVSLEELKPTMVDSYAFDFDGWQITIVANGFGITSMITSPVMERNGFAATFTDAPTIKDDILWFPIESLAALMNCTVVKNSAGKSLKITKQEIAASPERALEQVKKRMTSVKNNAVYPRPPIAYFEDILIPGPEGFISARLYDPNPGDRTTRSIYINIHGGAFSLGSIASSDHVCRDIANRSGQRVLSIEYGMLPEHPFPDGWEDAYAAALWTFENAGQLGIDPNRIFIGGDSAGASIANSVSMMARDRGVFTIAGQILAYPIIAMNASWTGFLYRDPADAELPYATATNGNLVGMPKSLLLIAETDGLRPQGEAYAVTLEEAGVEVDFSVVPGTKHGFLGTHSESREKIAQFIKNTTK